MLIPTISFPGTCNEAIAYYQKALNAEVKEIAHFRDAPKDSGMDESLPPDFVMHSELIIFGVTVSMTDGAELRPNGDNYSFGICLDSAEEVNSVFSKLADGGKIIEALAPQFWASLYGLVEDRFGVTWQVLTNN